MSQWMYGEKYGQAGRDGLDAGKVAAPRTHRGAINLPGDPANSGKRLHGALSCVSLLNYITVALVASLWALRLAQSRPELRVTPESGAATAFALIAAVSGMSGAAHLMGATRSRGSPTSTSLIAFAMTTNGFAVAFLFFGQMATWNLMAPDPSERGWSVAAVICAGLTTLLLQLPVVLHHRGYLNSVGAKATAVAMVVGGYGMAAVYPQATSAADFEHALAARCWTRDSVAVNAAAGGMLLAQLYVIVVSIAVVGVSKGKGVAQVAAALPAAAVVFVGMWMNVAYLEGTQSTDGASDEACWSQADADGTRWQYVMLSVLMAAVTLAMAVSGIQLLTKRAAGGCLLLCTTALCFGGLALLRADEADAEVGNSPASWLFNVHVASLVGGVIGVPASALFLAWHPDEDTSPGAYKFDTRWLPLPMCMLLLFDVALLFDVRSEAQADGHPAIRMGASSATFYLFTAVCCIVPAVRRFHGFTQHRNYVAFILFSEALDMFLTMGSADSFARDGSLSIFVAYAFLVVGWVNAVTMIIMPYVYTRLYGNQSKLAVLHGTILVADICSDLVLVFVTVAFQLYESSGFALAQLVVGILMIVKSAALTFTPWVFCCAPDHEDDNGNNPARPQGNAAAV